MDRLDTVVLLVCGLPGAGKTSLARRVEQAAATTTSLGAWRVQRLSFDDLFRAHAANADEFDEFDPIVWKRCQREMTERVKNSTTSGQRLILLVDDNFQYRSLRKRFAHLAAEVDCGFGILHVNTPLSLCRMRNAARKGAERVPDAVFERMASVFEASDCKQYPFERNTVALSVDDPQDTSTAFEAFAQLVRNATELLQEKRRLILLNNVEQLQRTQDQQRTHTDVVHRVDLQLRKWISSALSQHSAEATSKSAKAELAQQLNHARKVFLAQLKTCSFSVGEGTEDAASGNVEIAVTAHVESFHCQFRDL